MALPTSVRSPLPFFAALALFFCVGCKSPQITATVINNTGAPVTLIEVDYPDASFGRDVLAANASFPYQFRIIGNGPTKISWTDTARHTHTSTGPNLQEGQRGQLVIVLTPTGATWKPTLQ